MKPTHTTPNSDFPPNFLFGTATAATQIEGGEVASSWLRWSSQGKTRDGSTTRVANDHWNRYREDNALMQKLGLHTARIGLEWARLEPAPGQYNTAALSHYREEISLLIASGIRPLVTMHHFSNPLWFEDSGGWIRGDSAQIFVGLVRFVTEGLGDLVSDWITINEPSVYLLQGYVFGEWPPGHQSLWEYIRGSRNMIHAHRLAYEIIHSIRSVRQWDLEQATMVGVAHHLRVFDPLHSWNPVARIMCRVLEWCTQGRFLAQMTGTTRQQSSSPKRSVADFVGINYYTRDMVAMAWDPRTFFTTRTVFPGATTSDLGWEIYPEGLKRLMHATHKKYRLPIWITENGIADASDRLRSQFLQEHLQVIAGCLAEGLPVERYYHWTFIDNFEWLEGGTARFGLVANDFSTQERTLRASGELFARICASRSLALS